MTTEQLLNAYHAYAAASARADAQFDLATFPSLPERPDYTAAVQAGELISERGIAGALQVAEYGIEDPDSPERFRDACQLIIDAAR